MIDRRHFMHTAAAAAAGIACGCADGAAQSSRRRAVRRGAEILRSAGGRLEASLEAAESSVDLGGRKGRLFAFNGLVPGPRFELEAGDEVTLMLDNALGEPTNLHFHGLHVPPTGAADNIFLHVPSGESFTYRFTIPPDHPAGLFWIHPHLHGSVARQVSRGLAAPFVIRGAIDEVPEVAAADEFIFVVQDFELGPAGEVLEPSMPELMLGREGSFVTLGGSRNPVIPIRRGGLVRLRLVNGSASRFYRLRLEEHPLHLIGVDGGALDAVRTVDEILFLPGERLDILVKGTRDEGAFRLLDLPYDRGMAGMMGGMMGGGMMGGARGGSGSATPTTLATFEYRGRAEKPRGLPQALPGTLGALPRPGGETRRFQLGQGMGMGRGMSFTINGREFAADRIDSRVGLGSVEEWEYVNNTPMDHPMHLHTNPFQLVGADGSVDPAWRDVVLVPANGRARFRVRFDDFAGKAVHHCHILDHEDQGMMATVMMES